MFFETPITQELVYRGRIVNVRADTARLHNDVVVPREVVEHPGGVCIVPVDEKGLCYLVRQFRYPFGEELLEFPAGKLEPGEDPLHCAVRELKEETGLVAGRVSSLGAIYPSPGYCQEVLHLYLAQDLSQGEACPDENEFVSVEKLPLDTLVQMVGNDEIRDAKTLAGVFRAKLYLEKEANG